MVWTMRLVPARTTDPNGFLPKKRNRAGCILPRPALGRSKVNRPSVKVTDCATQVPTTQYLGMIFIPVRARHEAASSRRRWKQRGAKPRETLPREPFGRRGELKSESKKETLVKMEMGLSAVIK